MADLKFLEKDETQPELAKLAKSQLENYRFPVMMMVVLPNGTIIHSINANEFMETEHKNMNIIDHLSFEEPTTTTYVNFLMEGLEKAQRAMQQDKTK